MHSRGLNICLLLRYLYLSAVVNVYLISGRNDQTGKSRILNSGVKLVENVYLAN